jgi:uncharacterized protein YigE (DUF2233 family)
MYKIVISTIALLGSFYTMAAKAFDVERSKIANTHAIVVTVDIREDHLQLYLNSSTDQLYQTFQAINLDLSHHNKKLGFAMNAGMFHPNYLPVGLYIEQGKQYFPINLQQGWGNFFLQPNGVFLQHSQRGLMILSSSDYAQQQPKDVMLATQSGPMLVHQGNINPLFKPDSSSRVIRNAVGVVSPHQAKFVITEQAVNFYELADFFKNKLGVQQALYLDGTISSLYLPELKRHDRHRLLGPIIGVVEDR